MKKTLLLVGTICATIFACTHEPLSPVTVGSTPTSPATPSNPVSGGSSGSSGGTTSDTVCFSTEVLPLFQSYCANTGCHNSTSAKEGVILTDYNSIMRGISAGAPSSSRYYTIITNGNMPPGGSPKLTSAQLATIQKWINQGALNTNCSGGSSTPGASGSTCDTTKYTYSNGISQIFTTYCNACHGTAPGTFNILLSNYSSAVASVKSVGANTFLSALNYTMPSSAQNMPPAAKLSSCQISLITKWINNGFPQ